MQPTHLVLVDLVLVILEATVYDHEDVKDGPLVLHILKICWSKAAKNWLFSHI
jgi:hypothetical protein